MRPALLVLIFAAAYILAQPLEDIEAITDKGGRGRSKPPKSKPKSKPKPKNPSRPSGDDSKGNPVGDLAKTAAKGVLEGAAKEAGRVAVEKIVGSGEETEETSPEEAAP